MNRSVLISPAGRAEARASRMVAHMTAANFAPRPVNKGLRPLLPSQTLNLKPYGITVDEVYRNAPVALLYELAARYESRDTCITATGAMAATSGDKTGRTPMEKRIVKESTSQDVVWWESNACIPLSENSWEINKETAIDGLNTRPRLYVVDAFVNWDPNARYKVRIICARAYHALFMWNMLIRPTEEELKAFVEPDVTCFNAGMFKANTKTPGVTSKTSVNLNLKVNQAVILGTEYAGEMKKGIFTFMHYLMPKRGFLTMHASCNTNSAGGNPTIFFGLSGTGKTTLSADERRRLIGDDEAVWTDDGVFNIEGGCYAKCIDLTEEQEPLVYRAIKYGSVLENTIQDHNRSIEFFNKSIAENTRVAYPIEYIPNALIPCIAPHPTNVIFLSCDAFGVLPPVSRLTHDQAMYHFINGYTAKVAGTEMGVKEPTITFSACFGEAFLILHPASYAGLLGKKLEQFKCGAWLVNTGWSGGPYGVGKRMKLKTTRAILDAIHDGSLNQQTYVQNDNYFRFQVPTACPGVDSIILQPRNTWQDKAAYDATLLNLARRYNKNFKKYSAGASPAMREAGPPASIGFPEEPPKKK